MSEFRTPMKAKAIDISERITIPPSPFLNKLGYGTGISVVELVRSPKAGQLRSPWALKMLNKRVKPNKLYIDRLQAEADLLRRMSHPNIVGFRAFSKGKILYLGMEACDLSLGDLIDKKLDEDCEPFAPKKILKVVSDISKALDYLHTKMKILHGDIKSYNVLVNGDFMICKLCDFGVTVPLDQNGVFDKENAGKAVYIGTEAWSAPEVLNGGTITSKADIWALGMTIWEMLALMPPHSLAEDDTLLNMSMDSLESSFEDVFTEKYGTRPDIPCTVSETAYSGTLALFHCCTETDACQRPTAKHLTQAAEHFQAALLM